jgi:cytochrome c peroxidase
MKVPASAFLLAAALVVGGFLANATTATSGSVTEPGSASEAEGPPDRGLPVPGSAEVLLGDRLFFESRFAQYFFARFNGDVNAPLSAGDPVMDPMPELAGTTLLGQPLQGRFRGQSMNCRQCHLGDDFLYEQPMAGRTYVDFSTRSPIPHRGDGHVETPRNSPLMINLGLPREVPLLLHFDGEFATFEDLVIDTLTGRNFGWLPTERATAVAHIARVIREDQGTNPRLLKWVYGVGMPYRDLLRGTGANLPRDARIPPQYRIDVDEASDEEILMAIAKLMRAYMEALRFGTENTRRTAGSPYDLFLEKNGLPKWPARGEADIDYAARLLRMIEERPKLEWVTPKDGEFELHRQSYEFGPQELAGLKIFFTRGSPTVDAHAGNCVTCHTPPQFTDYSLHNNGVAQAEYDAIFGHGAFAKLEVPGLAERNARFDEYLPASPNHPNASGRFRSPPSPDRPGNADLGVWNVYANPDMPKPQSALNQILCKSSGPGAASCPPEEVLPRTLATFKTPAIRDLGQSNPYFHSGAVDTIEDVLRFYLDTSHLARAGEVRNASPELSDIRIDVSDIAPLAAFLRSLNEDYH